MKQGWKLLKKTDIFVDPYFVLQKWLLRVPNGSRKTFLMRGGPYNFVVVCAVTPKRRVVILRQYYISQSKKIHSLVMGIISGQERPAATARRELLEETGYRAGELIYLGSGIKGKYILGKVYFYLALEASKAMGQKLEAAEDIDVLEVSLTRFKIMLRNYQFSDPFAEAGAWRALHYLNRRKHL